MSFGGTGCQDTANRPPSIQLPFMIAQSWDHQSELLFEKASALSLLTVLLHTVAWVVRLGLVTLGSFSGDEEWHYNRVS